MIEREPRLAEP